MNKRITLALLGVMVTLVLCGCAGLAQKAKSLSTRGSGEANPEVLAAEKSSEPLPASTALPMRKAR